MSSGRLKWSAAALVAAATAAAGAVTSLGGAPATERLPQRFTLSFLTVGGTDEPVYVSARGPISGVGTVTQTERETPEGQVNYVTLRLQDGTVRLVARERYGVRLNRRACTGTPWGDGTFEITGGTRAYRGASGQGTLSVGGLVMAQRTATGRCLGERTPRARTVFFVKVTMTGRVTVPAGGRRGASGGLVGGAAPGALPTTGT